MTKAPAAFRLTGYHHVQLSMPPGREDDADLFYTGVLGMRRVPKPESLAGRGGCWFRAGDLELHLGVEPGFSPSAKAHPAIRVAGLAGLRERLGQAAIDMDEGTQLDGHERFYVRDPFGNRIELIEELG